MTDKLTDRQILSLCSLQVCRQNRASSFSESNNLETSAYTSNLFSNATRALICQFKLSLTIPLMNVRRCKYSVPVLVVAAAAADDVTTEATCDVIAVTNRAR